MLAPSHYVPYNVHLSMANRPINLASVRFTTTLTVWLNWESIMFRTAVMVMLQGTGSLKRNYTWFF